MSDQKINQKKNVESFEGRELRFLNIRNSYDLLCANDALAEFLADPDYKDKMSYLAGCAMIAPGNTPGFYIYRTKNTLTVKRLGR